MMTHEKLQKESGQENGMYLFTNGLMVFMPLSRDAVLGAAKGVVEADASVRERVEQALATPVVVEPREVADSTPTVEADYYTRKKMTNKHVISLPSRELAELLNYSGDEVMKVRMKCGLIGEKNGALLVKDGGVAVNVDEGFDFALSEHARIGLKAVADAVPAQVITLAFDIKAKTVSVGDIKL